MALPEIVFAINGNLSVKPPASTPSTQQQKSSYYATNAFEKVSNNKIFVHKRKLFAQQGWEWCEGGGGG